jgi:hypothetical protein
MKISPHGTTNVGDGGSGAKGSAGNIGGFIFNSHAHTTERCINNGPFSHCS